MAWAAGCDRRGRGAGLEFERGDDLVEVGDRAVRDGGGVVTHFQTFAVDPGCVDTHGLGTTNVGEEVVTDVPCLIWGHADGFQGMPEDLRVGLSAAEFTFNDDHVEVALELEANDLFALLVSRPVREKCSPDPGISDGLKRCDGIIEEAGVLPESLAIFVGDTSGDGRIDAFGLEGALDANGAGAIKIEAPMANCSPIGARTTGQAACTAVTPSRRVSSRSKKTARGREVITSSVHGNCERPPHARV